MPFIPFCFNLRLLQEIPHDTTDAMRNSASVETVATTVGATVTTGAVNAATFFDIFPEPMSSSVVINTTEISPMITTDKQIEKPVTPSSFISDNDDNDDVAVVCLFILIYCV